MYTILSVGIYTTNATPSTHTSDLPTTTYFTGPFLMQLHSMTVLVIFKRYRATVVIFRLGTVSFLQVDWFHGKTLLSAPLQGPMI